MKMEWWLSHEGPPPIEILLVDNSPCATLHKSRVILWHEKDPRELETTEEAKAYVEALALMRLI